jgi:hypothetical protein
MALNLGALKKVTQDLNERTGDKNFLYGKDLTDDTVVRILPPLESLQGKYFIEVIVWWIKGKKYVSPATFGKKDIIQIHVDEAKTQTKDKGLKALAEHKDIERKYEYYLPILHLERKGEDDYKVVDDKAKVLSTGTMLLKQINKRATHKSAQNGTDDGFTDFEEGFNMDLSKTGSKLSTEYDAVLGDQWEVPEKYRANYPDVYEVANKELKTNAFLEGVISNYLYGTEIPEDGAVVPTAAPKKPAKKAAEEEEEEEEEEQTPAPKKKAAAKKAAAKKVEEPEAEEEEEEEEEAPKKPAAKKAGRSLLDTLDMD